MRPDLPVEMDDGLILIGRAIEELLQSSLHAEIFQPLLHLNFIVTPTTSSDEIHSFFDPCPLVFCHIVYDSQPNISDSVHL